MIAQAEHFADSPRLYFDHEFAIGRLSAAAKRIPTLPMLGLVEKRNRLICPIAESYFSERFRNRDVQPQFASQRFSSLDSPFQRAAINGAYWLLADPPRQL